ncbi:Cof-type HAD-IIB family hydrolase [Terribacillus sp. 7520-G]|uniref:Cof-type HAD-IIB family hydrolase n=1 Tax=Terribacillus TaxID=459532 RepID=UPI000BA6CECB|nr:Cof-type HAD-IIB family hydrolase [Terribacillus sp. 7520-G]PAD39932.1 hydrolase Cof [Terribacillus sp. 7520-G]
MGKSIVFLDIDGTILNTKGEIPQATKDAVQALKDNGHYVAIATGRAPFMFEDIRKELDITSFVSYNGQYVVFEGEVIHRNPIERQHLLHLYDEASEKGHAMVFMGDTIMKASETDNSFVRDSLASLGFTYPEIDKDYFHHEPIYQSLLFCEEEEEQAYSDHHEHVRFIRWHPLSCDVLPADGSKKIGVTKLLEAADIPVHAAYACGDGLNDLEMIEFAGTGIVMGNAVPELKELADIQTAHVDEDGLALGLKKAGLI